MLTEAEIKAAPTSGKKSIELKDDGERGAGRLALLIRNGLNRVSAEWYAVYHRPGIKKSGAKTVSVRRLVKIGAYPTMPLTTARKIFREECAPAISAGSEPSSQNVRRRHKDTNEDSTVDGLFRAYVSSLKAEGKRSWVDAERILLDKKTGGPVERQPSLVPTSKPRL